MQLQSQCGHMVTWLKIWLKELKQSSFTLRYFKECFHQISIPCVSSLSTRALPRLRCSVTHWQHLHQNWELQTLLTISFISVVRQWDFSDLCTCGYSSSEDNTLSSRDQDCWCAFCENGEGTNQNQLRMGILLLPNSCSEFTRKNRFSQLSAKQNNTWLENHCLFSLLCQLRWFRTIKCLTLNRANIIPCFDHRWGVA